MGEDISDAEFNAVVDGLLSRYAGALDQMAKGVMPHESDIGPATEAIRKELSTLRAKLSAAEAQGEDFRKMVLAMHTAARGEAGYAVAEVGRLRQEHDAAEAQGEAMREALGSVRQWHDAVATLLRDLANNNRDHNISAFDAEALESLAGWLDSVAEARRALEGAKGI